MAKTTRTPMQISRDEDIIIELMLKGWTQTRIAEYLEISQPQVAYDIKKIKKRWAENVNANLHLERKMALRRLELIEREAWSAWERSQSPEITEMAERVSSGIDSEKVSKKSVSKVGDASFLTKILDASKERHSILGLNVTKPSKNTTESDLFKGLIDTLSTNTTAIDAETNELLASIM